MFPNEKYCQNKNTMHKLFIGYDEPAAISESDNGDLVLVSQGDHFLTVKH